MICWMYPGQPLKYMTTHPDDADFRDIAAVCRKLSGFDICTLPVSSTAEISETVALQLYGVSTCLYKTRQLLKAGMQPDMVTQHSMGIYAALAACGSVSEATALELTFRIGQRMAEMGKKQKYLLSCIIGLPADRLMEKLEGAPVYVANFNTSRHLLLAGTRNDMLAVMERATAAGAFSVSSFACDAPLHTPLMAEISRDVRSIVAEYRYAVPRFPLVSHKGELIETPEQISSFLHDELFEPVYWEKTIAKLNSLGVSRFIEVSFNDTLKKFNRWIESEQAIR